MANGPPSTSAGPSSTSTPSATQPAQRLQVLQQQAAAAQAVSQPGNIYSFSVHQPYPNWPLHPSGTPYAPSWYTLPPHYATPRTFKENFSQTDGSFGSLGVNGSDGVNGAAIDDGTTVKKDGMYRRHWDSVFVKFLKRAGLFQALRGFEEDMVMISEEWEKVQIPNALKSFVEDITSLMENDEDEEPLPEKPLEERKLEHIRFQKNMAPQSPSTITKSISKLLAENRKRNNASNRAEFLQSLTEKRRRLAEMHPAESIVETTESTTADASITTTSAATENRGQQEPEREIKMEVDSALIPAPTPSCARTDAKPQNRDLQMKYDIAKNEDGPLKRTMKGSFTSNPNGSDKSATVDGGSGGIWKGKQKAVGFELNGGDRGGDDEKDGVTVDRHPGLATRFDDVEAHLAVRYVPAPPKSLWDRIKFLEDHIIQLEREYPPWAALHFNQPSRGWPPPPRLSPIIVPSHLTSSAPESSATNANRKTSTFASSYAASTFNPSQSSFSTSSSTLPQFTQTNQSQNQKGSSGKARANRGKSSLHRAVMEKLEVQKVIGDFTSSGAMGFTQLQFQVSGVGPATANTTTGNASMNANANAGAGASSGFGSMSAIGRKNGS